MHPVLKNILARKNKNRPFNDGRSITLVLYGGLMTGVRGAGAMVALEELGLSQTFDEIYTISAGLPNASCLLAGCAKINASVYYEELAGSRFINFFRFWQIVDIDFLIKVMKYKKPIKVNKVIESPTRLYSRVINKTKQQKEYLEIHDVGHDQYYNLLRASVSVPIFHPGNTRIGNCEYDDPGLGRHNCLEHDKNIMSTKATDILMIYNHPGQKQIDLGKSDRICQICPPKEWGISHFENRGSVLSAEAQKMGDLVKRELGDNQPVDLYFSK
jgi:predicted patatin/cPLA2 family phospholipase